MVLYIKGDSLAIEVTVISGQNTHFGIEKQSLLDITL